MNISLNQVIPGPLRDEAASHPVWGKQLSFMEGNRYLLRAASGRGKSTLLHLIYGLRKDYTGEILLGSSSLSHASTDQTSNWRSRHLSMVFQDLRLFPQLTALENLELKARLTGFDLTRVLEHARSMGVESLLNRTCGTLSYGQQQRIAILRALSQPFDWLLLDEPFSHLDEANIEIITEILDQECRQNNAGILISSLGARYALAPENEVLI